jgi:LacI family transcriptional regulator
MKDVAEKARVSVSTVSHVLNGTRKVSEETRTLVLGVVDELGYEPNLLARSFKQQKTFTVGLLVSDIQNPFFTSVARGVEDVALAHGYHLLLCNTDEDPEREAEYVTELYRKRVDGVIVASSAPRQAGYRSPKVPCVFMDREVEGTSAGIVRVDNAHGMRLIAEHLVKLGHERIAMISGPLEKASGFERYEGLKTALAELGLELDGALVRFGDFRAVSGERGARELLSLPEPPTALVTANNQMTLGALATIKEIGVRVPQELSVVGFDDTEWAPLVEPPLTAVAQPTYELGAASMRVLLERIEGGENGEPERLFLEPRLVIRGSTASPVKRQG